MKFLVMRDLTQSQKSLLDSKIDFSLFFIQRDKVKWCDCRNQSPSDLNYFTSINCVSWPVEISDMKSIKVLWIVFHFVVKIFVTTLWRHSHFKSAFYSLVHANSKGVSAWRHFSFVVELVLGSFAWWTFCHARLKNDLWTLKRAFLYFHSKR